MAPTLYEVSAISSTPGTEPADPWRLPAATGDSRQFILGGVYLTTAALVASGMGAWWISPIVGVLGVGSFALAFRRVTAG